MKKILAAITASVLVFGSGTVPTLKEAADSISLSASAAEMAAQGKCGENLTWTLDAEGTLTISGTGDMDDYGENGRPWIDYSDKIKKAVIEDGVTRIGNGAFYFCKNLSDVTISESVTSLGIFAFCDCSSLENVTIPESITSIGYSVFEGCSSLTSITIPDGVANIGNYTFYKCSSLTSITILNSYCEIYDSEDTISATAVIRGCAGSTAQAYAEKFERKFALLGGELPVKYDVDGDGKVSISDATMVLTIYANQAAGNSLESFTAAQIKAADVNGDGSISIADATAILKSYANTAAGIDDPDVFVKKEIKVDFYKIPEVYSCFLTDREIDFYNRFVTAWLNYEPMVEYDNSMSLINVWGMVQECFLLCGADLDVDSGYDVDDHYVYLNYLSDSKEEHDRIICEFEERVQTFFDNIDENEEGIESAYKLYVNFNSTLDYSYDVYESENYTFANSSGYTAMMEGKGVCSSFAKAYTYLLRQAGFEAFPVSCVSHEWGAVKIDDKYYFVDPTWDYENDPLKYQYFCFGLDQRIIDGFSESEMVLCCNGDNKMQDYVEIEHENYKFISVPH